MQAVSLLRALKLRDAVGVGLGAIIGAGIFVVTGVAAGVAGPAFILGLMIAGVIATCNGLSSAQLAAVYPQSGGTYEYGYELLSPGLGFSAGWMFLVSKLSAAGVVAIGFGSYFHQLVPGVSAHALSLGAIVLLTLANYFGVKKAGNLNLMIITITLLSLLYFILSGLGHVSRENFTPFAPFGIGGIAESAALLFFAFTGYARIATLAEEVSEPQKTIPRAVIITLVTAIILYIAASVVATGTIGFRAMAGSPSPLQDAAEGMTTPGIVLVVTLGASTAMLGVLLSQILGISRMMLAMSRRKDLPALFGRIHPRFRVPHTGILFTGTIAVILTLTGTFEFILRTAAFSILLYYSITNIAALRQPRGQRLFHKTIPLLGLAGCLAMALSLPGEVIISGVLILGIGLISRAGARKWYY